MSTKARGLPGHMVIDTSMQKTEGITINAPSRAADAGTYSRCQLLIRHKDLSSTAVQHEERETSLANVSTIDKQKVAQLRQAIREGTYRIDAERIADKLIALEQTLSKVNK
jgi:negative regulator of flagellin synthesis FlgM